jgi:hypothetical protein
LRPGRLHPDFQDWLARTARLIRERRWQEPDAEELADEVEDLGKSERRGITSQLTRLLVHLRTGCPLLPTEPPWRVAAGITVRGRSR